MRRRLAPDAPIPDAERPVPGPARSITAVVLVAFVWFWLGAAWTKDAIDSDPPSPSGPSYRGFEFFILVLFSFPVTYAATLVAGVLGFLGRRAPRYGVPGLVAAVIGAATACVPVGIAIGHFLTVVAHGQSDAGLALTPTL